MSPPPTSPSLFSCAALEKEAWGWGEEEGWSGGRKNATLVFGPMNSHVQGIGARPYGLFKEYMNAHSAWLYDPGLLKLLLFSLAWH